MRSIDKPAHIRAQLTSTLLHWLQALEGAEALAGELGLSDQLGEEARMIHQELSSRKPTNTNNAEKA